MNNKGTKHEFACNAGKVTEYEVKKHIDTIMVGFRGFSKEVTIVKWSDRQPVFDIRAWRVSDIDGLSCMQAWHKLRLRKKRKDNEKALSRKRLVANGTIMADQELWTLTNLLPTTA